MVSTLRTPWHNLVKTQEFSSVYKISGATGVKIGEDRLGVRDVTIKMYKQMIILGNIPLLFCGVYWIAGAFGLECVQSVVVQLGSVLISFSLRALVWGLPKLLGLLL